MGAYSPDDIPVVFEEEGVGRVRHLATEGGMTIEISHLEPGFDVRELFRGLPDDRCQCHHWGYVIEGEMVYLTGDGEVVVRAGQAYHIPPGHLPLTRERGCTVIELSPTEQLAATMETVGRNMEAAQAGAGA